jgi:hypothetical protein
MRLSLNGDNVEIELDVMVSIAQIQGECEAKYKVVRRSVVCARQPAAAEYRRMMWRVSLCRTSCHGDDVSGTNAR